MATIAGLKNLGPKKRRPTPLGDVLLRYRYIAYSVTGALVDSTVRASGEDAAEASLVKAGFRPLVIRLSKQSFSLEKLFRSKKVKPQLVLNMTEQLAVLMRAAVPLATALESLHGQFRNPEFNEALEGITRDVRGGLPLSRAMAKYTHIFSALYVKMIALGEGSGDMEAILEQIRVYLTRELNLKKKIQRAMFYPMMVVVMAAVVGIGMVTFVLPRIITMFDALNVPLPLITRIVLGSSTLMINHMMTIGIAFLLFGLIGLLMLRQPGTKLRLHHAALRLPLLKNIVIYRELGRFSRLASLMLRNGLPLPAILEMTQDIASNLAVKKSLQSARADVTSGLPLSSSLKQASFMPIMFMQMIGTGEISRNLESNLSSVADFYDHELDSLIEAALSMLEPMLTIAIGVVGGGIAISVVMPIYSIIGGAG